MSWSVRPLEEDDTHPTSRQVVDADGNVVCDILLDGSSPELVDRMNHHAHMIAGVLDVVTNLKTMRTLLSRRHITLAQVDDYCRIMLESTEVPAPV